MSFVITRDRYETPKPEADQHWKDYAWCLVKCPGCDKLSTMAKSRHQVAADGTVSPSYVCPFPPCTFHEFVRLEEWPTP